MGVWDLQANYRVHILATPLITTLCSGKMLHQQWAKVRCYDPNAPLQGVGEFCFSVSVPPLGAYNTQKHDHALVEPFLSDLLVSAPVLSFSSPCQDPGFTNLLPVFPQTNNPLLYMSVHPTVLLLPSSVLCHNGGF